MKMLNKITTLLFLATIVISNSCLANTLPRNLTDQIMVKEELLSEKQMKKATKEAAKWINATYKGKDVVVIGVLKGSVMFLTSLLPQLTPNIEVDFMMVKSYDSEQQHDIKVIMDVSKDLKNKHVLIVEDIIDSGNTLTKVREIIAKKQPASIKIITALDKKECRKVKLEADYSCFIIPNKFVVGFGLDYDQKIRHLSNIVVIKPIS